MSGLRYHNDTAVTLQPILTEIFLQSSIKNKANLKDNAQQQNSQKTEKWKVRF